MNSLSNPRPSPLAESERSLVAIIFTDMVGFTALTQSDEAQSLAVLERHNRLLRPIFSKFRGREVKTIGDSFLVEFDSALDATNCAVEIQRFLHDYNVSSRDEWKITLRVGVHLGDVTRSGGDILGDAVNIASRLQPLAEPEGVCISQQVYDQVRNKTPQALVKLEPRALKGVRFAVDVYRVVMPWEEAGFQAAPQLDPRRVAVLPLVSMSPDPNDEYFADGMTEELITRISFVKGLEVISRTSVMNYKNKEKNALQIGQELKVGTLLEGSVRKAGNRIRVTAQLINSNNEGHLWAESYDRDLNDVFRIQSEIAEKVAGELKVQLLQSEKKTLERKPTMNMEAYTLYLKGHSHINKITKDSLSRAVEFYQRAIDIDPRFAHAYAFMSYAYVILGSFELISAGEALPKAKKAATMALELDNGLAEAHVSLGRVLRVEWDLAGAENELRMATALDPNLTSAHLFLAAVLRSLGRVDESLAETDRAAALDPYSVGTCMLAGTNYLYCSKYDEAIEQLKRALELDPNLPLARDNLGLSYVRKGMVEEGVAEVRKSIELEGEDPQTKSDLAYALVKKGDVEEARQILVELLAMRERKQGVASAIAAVYASLGEKDNAFDWLERAYAEHSPYMVNLGSDFVFDGLRTDPRLKVMEKRLGLP